MSMPHSSGSFSSIRPERRLTAAEKLGEHLLEIDLHLLEGLGEELLRGPVDLLDRLEDLVLGGEKVGLLAGEELVALLQLVVFGDGLQVDRPDRLERGPLDAASISSAAQSVAASASSRTGRSSSSFW